MTVEITGRMVNTFKYMEQHYTGEILKSTLVKLAFLKIG